MGTETEKTGTGTLYMCPTPIGNLGDISRRVLDVLESVDVIAAEDTRNTLGLLNHFGIHTPLTSYHEHNKYDKADELIGMLSAGKSIACVTDAGTPGISDPGEVLVKKAVECGIAVSALPGATAFVTALVMSGLSTERFVFEAFLPRDNKSRRERLAGLSGEMRTIILYESPHHLKATLSELCDVLGRERRIALCRELTKIHEEVLRFSLEEALSYYDTRDPRGEYVLVIEGRSPEDVLKEKRESFEALSVKEHVDRYIASGMEKNAAMKAAAADRGVSKRDIYSKYLEEEG